MDSILSQMYNSMIGREEIEYIIVVTVLIVLLCMVYFYFFFKKKNKLQAILQQNIEIFQQAFDITEDAILIVRENYKVVFANKSMKQLLSLEEKNYDDLMSWMPKIKVKQTWETLDFFLNKQTKSILNVQLKNEESESIQINLHINSLMEEDRNKNGYYIVRIDILSREEDFVKNYKHMLTHLPNQLQAEEDIPKLFSKIHLESNKIALVLLSFDNFTRLRSIIGVEQSNKIIIKFSSYLKTITNDMTVSVYHTFDNDFLLTLSGVESIESVTLLVKEIQNKLASFYKMENVSLHLTVSAGISIYPESGPTRTLLDNAYKALINAQKNVDAAIEVFMPNKFITKYDELKLHNDMQRGLDNDEFEVYYQPIIQVSNKEVVSAEALIRWIHPEYGFIPPDVFIGLMEKTGFIIKLGQFVLEEVLKQQKRWDLFQFKQIQVAINVSMIEISTGEFVENVKKQLEYHQVNPELLKFEITEGTAMIGEVQTEKYFYKLKKLGVSISLDDFGTGYTSFSYLKKFPADILKIDKSMVDYILVNEEDQRIVKGMIELGHNLGMKVVVEGIENNEMVTLLTSYKCDYMQGYYFNKPLPVFEFQKLLR